MIIILDPVFKSICPRSYLLLEGFLVHFGPMSLLLVFPSLGELSRTVVSKMGRRKIDTPSITIDILDDPLQGYWYFILLSGRAPWINHDLHKKYGQILSLFHAREMLILLGPIVRIAPNHLSFNDHSAQKIIYGFGTETVPSMRKDPRFFTPEVDHSMNIINECDKEEHSRMRRMLSFAFGMSNLLKHEDVLTRRTDEFLDVIGGFKSEHGKKGINIVQKLNYVTFNIMGEMSFGDSWDLRLKEQPGLSLYSSRTSRLISRKSSVTIGPM